MLVNNNNLNNNYVYLRTYQQKETYILSLLGRNKTNTKLESHCSTTSGILLRECSLYVYVVVLLPTSAAGSFQMLTLDTYLHYYTKHVLRNTSLVS